MANVTIYPNLDYDGDGIYDDSWFPTDRTSGGATRRISSADLVAYIAAQNLPDTTARAAAAAASAAAASAAAAATAAAANSVPLNGSVAMTGPLTLFADPTVSTQAATKNYVDLLSVTIGNEATSRTQGDLNTLASAGENIGRDLLRNSLCSISQRGVGPFTAAGYFIDQWIIDCGSGGSRSVAPVAVGIGTLGDEQATRVASYEFLGGTGAGDYECIVRRIPGVLRLSNKTIAWQIAAKSLNGNSKLGFEVTQHFGTGGSPSATVTGIGAQAIQLSGAWTPYSAIVDVPSAAGKTLGANGDDYTEIRYWLSSGTTDAARASGIGVQSDTIGLWGDQVELGDQVTALEKLDPAFEFWLCNRFLTALPLLTLDAETSAPGQSVIQTIALPAPMRATPTVITITWATSVKTNVATQQLANLSPTVVQAQLTSTAAGRCANNLQGALLGAEL
jgi:hypothetical protein